MGSEYTDLAVELGTMYAYGSIFQVFLLSAILIALVGGRK